MAYRRGNYTFAVEDTYDPFSMQEVFYPIGLYKQEYDTEEAHYLDLLEKSNKFKYLSEILPEGSKARGIYEGYADTLNKQAQDFSKNGMSMSNQAALRDLRGRYSGEIGRLLDADTRRKADIEEQKKIALQDPTRMFSKDASLTSIDNYLDLQGQLPYKSYSGAMLASQVSTAASALAKSLNNYGNGQALDKYTKTWIEQHGFTPEQVATAINNPNDPNASPVLNTIVNEALNSSGIPSWGDNSTLQRARNYAVQGLWNAVGQSNIHAYDDYGAKLAAQTAASKELETYKAKLDVWKNQQTQQNQGTTGTRVNPLPLRDQNEISDANKKIAQYINDGYLMRDRNGRLAITQKGLKELRSKRGSVIIGGPYSAYANSASQLEDYGFKNWYNTNIGGFDPKTGKVSTPTTRLSRYEKANQEGAYDTYHTTEYDRQIGGDYAKEYTRQLWSAAGKDGLEQVTFGNSKDSNGNKSRGFVSDKKLKAGDLDGYTVSNVRYSKYGNTAILQKEGKEPIRVKLPKGINIPNEDRITTAITYADIYGDILVKGKQPKLDKNGNPVFGSDGKMQYTNTPLSDYDRVVLEEQRNQALNEMNTYGSQLVVPSTTETEKYGNFNY